MHSNISRGFNFAISRRQNENERQQNSIFIKLYEGNELTYTVTKVIFQTGTVYTILKKISQFIRLFDSYSEEDS